MLAIAAALVLIPFTIYSAFLALCTAKRVIDAGVELPLGWRPLLYFWYAVGSVADVLFNYTWGAFVIYGRPWKPEFRALTFSAHTQWRVDNGRWDDKTQLWARFLNEAAPNHIKRVPT